MGSYISNLISQPSQQNNQSSNPGRLVGKKPVEHKEQKKLSELVSHPQATINHQPQQNTRPPPPPSALNIIF